MNLDTAAAHGFFEIPAPACLGAAGTCLAEHAFVLPLEVCDVELGLLLRNRPRLQREL